jgi:hypothetical protein
VVTSVAAATQGPAPVTASIAVSWDRRSLRRAPTPTHASGTRRYDSPLYENSRFLITMSSALACEAGQTLIAMPLALPDTAEMLLCELVVPEVSQNQALKS